MISLIEKSKHLAYLLRHNPKAGNLILDKQGWCSVELVLKNNAISSDELIAIVLNDEKQRYSFSSNGLRIRANQGHSTSDVSLVFKRGIPPVKLYHGTINNHVGDILKHGLKPMKRHYVHLSADHDTALSVGGRRKGYALVFEVNAKQMLADGINFFLSDNAIWLVSAVPPQYLSKA